MMNQLQELWRAHQAARAEFENQPKKSLVEIYREMLDGSDEHTWKIDQAVEELDRAA